VPSSLNISALTQRTGVPSDTIRKWEQRYGVLHPERTPGGQRRYSELDVERIEWLKARIREGYRIGEAAALLGEGRIVAQTTDELRRAIVGATAASDAAGLRRLVGQALALTSLTETLLDVFAPALVAVGECWRAGEVTIAQEHLATGIVRSALQKLLSDQRPEVRGTAVLACAPGERHEVGLLMLAVLLRADGWQVAYLGADTPLGDAVELAACVDAAVVCVSTASDESRRALDRELERLAVRESPRLFVGGRATDRTDLRAAVAELRLRSA
jgi:MerR family transcriptional regulator, light-induced transcriptional regulator